VSRRGIGVVFDQVQLDGGAVGQHTATVDPGALGVQDAAHGRVFSMIRSAGHCFASWCTHLAALLGVGIGLLPGGIQQANALQATCRRAAFIITNMAFRPRPGSPISQPVASSNRMTQVGCHAAHLFFNALAQHTLRMPVGHELGHQKQRQAFGAGGASGRRASTR
jgi:hypothetical protein